jgi:predicted enzyme related to lactoylglutathione lyase
MSYTILSAGATPIGGLMALPEAARDAGARPSWIGYVGVDDVDASADEFVKAGGVVHRAAADIPGVGRFAVVGDPQGAALTLFKAASDAEPAPAPRGAPGHIGWRELHAIDREAAFAFYADRFGWTKGDAMDMGPMGVYQLFKAGGDDAIGGVMTKLEAMPVPFWLYYFNVAGIDAAAKAVEAAGGQILNGPHEVPGGDFILQGLDPQGAMFALVGPRG